MKRPDSCDRLVDREKVAVSPDGNTRYWGVFLGILVGLLVTLVAFSLCQPTARTAEAQGTPDQVTGVSASADDHDSITVSWNPAPDTCEGLRVLEYQPRWDDDSGFGSPDTLNPGDFISASQDSYQIDGLQETTEYFVQVRAVCRDTIFGYADYDAWSAPASATTLSGRPARVTGVSAVADDHDSITARWRAAARAEGYVVQWDTDSAFPSPNDAAVNSGSTVTYAIAGLQEDTEYHVRVYATRAGFDDGASSALASATTDLQPPSRVTGLSAVAASDVSIAVSWAAAMRADGYRVEWGTTSGAYTGSATTSSISHTITGLTHSTTYYIRVTATRTGAADGVPSAETSEATETAPTPGQVSGLALSALSDRELQATWTAAANATGYLVQWDTVDTFADPDEARASGTGVVIERLRAETEYHVRVQGARAGATAGAYSTSASATTGDAPTRVWAERFPGGAIAAQLTLSAFGGVMAGVRFKSMKSPRREAVITGAMSLGALILPAFGLANEFWVIGVALLVLLASIAAIFLARR